MIEFPSELSKTHTVDQPRVNQTSTPAATTGPVTDNLALLFNEEVVANNRALNHRQLILPLASVQMLKQIYNQLGHPAKKTFAMARLQIKQQLEVRGDVAKLLEVCEGDPTLTCVVLKNEEALGGTAAALARDARIMLEASFRGQIQAGLNTAAAFEEGCPNLQERMAVRMLYYESVVPHQSLPTMLQKLLDVYGVERFPEGLKVMQRALADDIAAKVSSSPNASLRTLLLGLQSCGQLSGVLAACQGLRQRLAVDHDAVVLLQRLLGFTGGGVGAAEILRFVDDLQSGSTAQQLLVLNALLPVVEQLPLALWPDSTVRNETLNCFRVVIGELDRIARSHARFPRELEARA